tara:strand:+ start:2510 stop:2689 length:180 start_codon:yes stop_codon:yes gene_type:complete
MRPNMSSILTSVLSAIVIGLLTWQISTVKNLVVDNEMLKYRVLLLEKKLKMNKPRGKSK